MRTSSVLLGLTVCLSLVAQPALASSDAAAPMGTAVKLYTGLYGSNDFVWGTANQSPPNDAWAVHSQMPNRMMDNAAATDGNHVYAAAGYSVGRIFYRHAVGSTTWETMAQCPLDLCTGGAAIIGDTFYYCGGYKTGMTEAADTLYKYSISSNSWTSGPGPFAGTGNNWSPTIVACAGKLYFMSGCAAPGATAPSTQVWRYTPGAGWAQVASLNVGRVFAHAVAYHDTIWMAGGNKDNVAQTHTEFYDPVADTWIVNNTVFPQLPANCWAGAAGVTANKMFVAAGVKAGAISTQNYVFDFASRTWSTETGMPLAVYRTVGCGANGDAIVYGGSTGGFTPSDTVQFNNYGGPPVRNDVGCIQVLAPPAQMAPGQIAPKVKFRNFGSDPQQSIPITCWIDSASTRVYNNTVTWSGSLPAGGVDSVTFPAWTTGQAGTYNITMFTDLSNDENRRNDTVRSRTQVAVQGLSWNQLTAAPSPGRYWCPGTGVYRDTIWFLGGRMAAQTSTRSITAYDIASGTWISSGLPTLTTPRRAGGGGRIGNKIYIAAGRDSSSTTLNTCHEFDLDTKTFTPKANMPASAWAVTGAVAGDKLYIIGSESQTGATYEYNPSSNTWATKATLSIGRGWACAAGSRGLVYAMGGSGASGTLSDCWCFNPVTNQWTQKANMPGPRIYSSAIAYNDSVIYVVGGSSDGAAAADNLVYAYNIAGNSWTTEAPKPTLSGWHMVNVVDGAMYVAYGSNCTTPTYLTNLDVAILPPVGIEVIDLRQPEAVCRISPSVVRDFARISYSVTRTARVELGIYDAAGKLVRTLVNGTVNTGEHSAFWNRTSNSGNRVANGTYFYRLTTDGRTVSSKAVVVE